MTLTIMQRLFVSVVVVLFYSSVGQPLLRPALGETPSTTLNPMTAAWGLNVPIFGSGSCVNQFMLSRGTTVGHFLYYSSEEAAYADFVSGIADQGFSVHNYGNLYYPLNGIEAGVNDPGCPADVFPPPVVNIAYDNGLSFGKGWGNADDKPGGCDATAGQNPITIWNGNEYKSIVDYSTHRQNELEFTRNYNSEFVGQTFATSLGSNWRSTYDRYLNLQGWSQTSGGTVIAERADGQLLAFSRSSGVSGAYTTDSDVDTSLAYNSTTASFTLIDGNDIVETYTVTNSSPSYPPALLTSITKRGGYCE